VKALPASVRATPAAQPSIERCHDGWGLNAGTTAGASHAARRSPAPPHSKATRGNIDVAINVI